MSLQVFVLQAKDKKAISIAVPSDDAEKLTEIITNLLILEHAVLSMLSKETPERIAEFKKLIVEADAALKKARGGE